MNIATQRSMMNKSTNNFALFNMVEQQIRPWNVLDEEILDLFFQIPRTQFVPPQYQEIAFSDVEIPLEHGEIMLSPKVVGRILQAIKPKRTDLVLEIGTGSGYLTALLSVMAKQVETVEYHQSIFEQAKRNLTRFENIHLLQGDANLVIEDRALYDSIILTASTPSFLEKIANHLKIGGELFAVIGTKPIMTAYLYIKKEQGFFEKESLFETCIPPLRGLSRPSTFVF